MNRTVLDLWVGFLSLFGIAAVMFLALKVGNLSSAHCPEPTSCRPSLITYGGLKVRGPVKSAGCRRGADHRHPFDPATYEAGGMTIDGRYRFPKDTFASIYTAGFSESSTSVSMPAATRNAQSGGRYHRQDAVGRRSRKVDQSVLFSKAADGQDRNDEKSLGLSGMQWEEPGPRWFARCSALAIRLPKKIRMTPTRVQPRHVRRQ